MESTPKNPSVIFSKEIDQYFGVRKLQELSADKLPTKSVWLLRESSVPGLLTVTYYDAESGKYLNNRIGYVGDNWRFGPADRSEAILFSNNAQLAFSNKLPENSAEKLFTLLSNNGFKKDSQIIPNPIEASRTEEFSRYVHFTLDDGIDEVEEAENKENSASDRYTPFV